MKSGESDDKELKESQVREEGDQPRGVRVEVGREKYET